MIAERFRNDVEDFLTRSGMTPTELGRSSVNNPSFVFRLRDGQSCRVNTMDRVYAFMRDHQARQEGAASQGAPDKDDTRKDAA